MATEIPKKWLKHRNTKKYKSMTPSAQYIYDFLIGLNDGTKMLDVKHVSTKESVDNAVCFPFPGLA